MSGEPESKSAMKKRIKAAENDAKKAAKEKAKVRLLLVVPVGRFICRWWC
jgi:hypothetical protein